MVFGIGGDVVATHEQDTPTPPPKKNALTLFESLLNTVLADGFML